MQHVARVALPPGFAVDETMEITPDLHVVASGPAIFEVAQGREELIALQVLQPTAIAACDHRGEEILESGRGPIWCLRAGGRELARPDLEEHRPADDGVPLRLPHEPCRKLGRRGVDRFIDRRRRAQKAIEPDRLAIARALAECDEPVAVAEAQCALPRGGRYARLERLDGKAHLSRRRPLIAERDVPPEAILPDGAAGIGVDVVITVQDDSLHLPAVHLRRGRPLRSCSASMLCACQVRFS